MIFFSRLIEIESIPKKDKVEKILVKSKKRPINSKIVKNFPLKIFHSLN